MRSASSQTRSGRQSAADDTSSISSTLEDPTFARIKITGKDIVILLASAGFLVALCTFGHFFDIGLPAVLIACTLLILFIILAVYRGLVENNDLTRKTIELLPYGKTDEKPAVTGEAWESFYARIESLLALFFTLRPPLPLPSIRDWSAAPDFLKTIMEMTLQNKPAFIVETGSGVSSIIMGYCLRKLGAGKMITLEHDAAYYALNKNLIASHGLDDVIAIIHAPLKTVTINGAEWLWYDTDCFSIDSPIDMLIVDGPPGNIQKKSRYPVLPLLHKSLSDSVRIIMDDGNREDERSIVAMWLREHGGFASRFLNLERGAYVLEKTGRPVIAGAGPI